MQKSYGKLIMIILAVDQAGGLLSYPDINLEHIFILLSFCTFLFLDFLNQNFVFSTNRFFVLYYIHIFNVLHFYYEYYLISNLIFHCLFMRQKLFCINFVSHDLHSLVLDFLWLFWILYSKNYATWKYRQTFLLL